MSWTQQKERGKVNRKGKVERVNKERNRDLCGVELEGTLRSGKLGDVGPRTPRLHRESLNSDKYQNGFLSSSLAQRRKLF
jgi:hypothetical protein